MLTCTRTELQRFMLRQQCLLAPADTVEQAVTQILGCRAAEGSTPYVSLLWRVKDFDPARFDRSVHQDRSLLRVKGPRGTNFWVTPALAPMFLAAARNEPQEQFLLLWRLKEGEYQAIAGEVATAVSGCLLGVSELKKRIPAALQRTLHRKGSAPSTSLMVTLQAMQLSGQITLLKEPGFERHKSREYFGDVRDVTRPNLIGLVSELYPTVQAEAVDPIDARRELVRAYIRTYGPVSLQDVVWWTGWTKREVKQHLVSLGHEVETIRVEGLPHACLVHTPTWETGDAGQSEPSHSACLLPGGDSLMKGYDSFERFLARRIDDHNVLRFMPAVLVDGLGVGNWAYRLTPEKTQVIVELFEPFDRPFLESAVMEAATRMGRLVSDQASMPVEVCLRERSGRWNPRAPFPETT